MITENKQEMTPDVAIKYISNQGYLLENMRMALERLKSGKPTGSLVNYKSRNCEWLAPAVSYLEYSLIDVLHIIAVSMMEAKINEIDADLKMLIK